MVLEIVPLDDCQYRYKNGEWVLKGRGKDPPTKRFYMDRESPAFGSRWQMETVSFQCVRFASEDAEIGNVGGR